MSESQTLKFVFGITATVALLGAAVVCVAIELEELANELRYLEAKILLENERNSLAENEAEE